MTDLITEEKLKLDLREISDSFKISLEPRPFQLKFLLKAIMCISGFLLAPCGSGKSYLYQMLPFVMKKHRFSSVESPVVVVIEPLTAISLSQLAEQKVPSVLLVEGGLFKTVDEKMAIITHPIEEVEMLASFTGVVYSSPEVWDGSHGMTFKLHFSERIVSLVVDEADKINQWGPRFREGYTRLGLMKPFFADKAPIFCLTATATEDDIRVACEILNIKNDLNMNICCYRGEYIKSIFRPNSTFGWEGSFCKDENEVFKHQPGLRELLVEEYLDSFVSQVETFPSTIMLFRDQTHLGLTADILRQKLGYKSPEHSKWIQFHGLVDPRTLEVVFRRFADASNGYKLILMTTKGLCGTHISNVERTVMVRPLSAPHDLMQLCGRGGRGPDIFSSTLEVIWNNNDISNNVPGMTASVRHILDQSGCIAQKLCSIFSYRYEKISGRKCCSNCG